VERTVELTTHDLVAEMLEKSRSETVLLYKHSVSCPISGHAWYEVQDCLSCVEDFFSCYRVTVQTQPEISQAVAHQLAVVHHTPQVIVIRDARARYVASHWQIRKQSLQRALATAGTAEENAG
jgi:bacillithiol system protein YtxJ